MTQQLIEWRFDSSDAPDMLDFASGYGTTWVSESFVRRTLHKEISEYSCMRLPRGLNGHQDVYVVVKEERVDFSSLEYRSGAEGFVESANPRVDGGFSCSGWAASIDRSKELERVDLLINGGVVASCGNFSRRPDVAAHYRDDRLEETGWELAVEMPNGISHGHDVVMIVAEGAPGKTILAMGCVHSLVADSARANRRHLKTATVRYIAGAAGPSRRCAKVADLLGRLRRTMSPR